MNEIFNFKGQEVRTVTINNEPYFLGNDVANIRGYKRPGDAIKQHIDEDDRKTLTYKAFGDLEHSLWKGNDFSNKTFITESGVYALIFGSELPQAKEFKRWVTSEVLPQIRLQGAYVPENLSDEAFIALFKGQKQLKAQQLELAHDVDYLKNEQPIHPSFAQALLKKRKARVVAMLGGLESPAYADKAFAQSVFRQAEIDFKDHFSISRYDMLPKKFADAALSYWMTWEPSTNTKMKIMELNAYEM